MAITLNKITTDLLNIVRGADVSRDEPISKNQLEYWVHQYRALLLKRDLDQNRYPHPDYVQEFNGLVLEKVDKAGSNAVSSELYTLRTVLDLPKFLDLNDRIGITFIGTVTGDEIQLMSQQRSPWQQYKSYTKNNKIAYIKGDKLYIERCPLIRYVTVRGVLEDPTVAKDYSSHTGISTYTNDSSYPIPADKLPALKELILQKELGIMYKERSDNDNDSDQEVSPNIKND